MVVSGSLAIGFGADPRGFDPVSNRIPTASPIKSTFERASQFQKFSTEAAGLFCVWLLKSWCSCFVNFKSKSLFSA